MAVTSETSWVNQASGTAPRNGTGSHTVSFGFTSKPGNLIVFLCYSAADNAEASGTWTERAQPGGSAELSLFTKTSTGETSITINHNVANHPMLWVAYEFLTGSAYTTATSSSTTSEAFPTLSGLPGMAQVVIAARGRASSSSADTNASTAWDSPTVEDADLFTPYTSTVGLALTAGHQLNVTAGSVTPSATTTYTGTWAVTDRQRIVAAFDVAVPATGSPTNLFTTQTPASTNVSEGAPGVTVATTVWFSKAGTISGGRFFAPTTVTGTFQLALWQVTADDSPAGSGTGTLLGTATFGTLTPGAWNSVSFASPIAVTANTAYRIGVRTSDGRYTATSLFFSSSQLVNAGITAQATGTNPTGIGPLDNGSYATNTTSYPNLTYNGGSYFVDPTWTAAQEVPAPTTVTVSTSMPAAVAGGPAPTVVAGRDRPVLVGGSVQLDAVATPVAPDTIASWSWTVQSGAGSLTGQTTSTPTYVAPSSGTGVATIRVQAAGANGGIGTATMTVGYGPNIVAAENQLTGTPRVDWDLTGGNLGGLPSLQGFCDGFSVDKNSTVNFKIAQSTSSGWTAQVFRLGYYGGAGARLIAQMAPSGSQLTASQTQPAPQDTDPDTTKLSADCSNWATTLTWTPPAWAPSGIYILHLYSIGGGVSHVMFVLRDDARAADLMLMPSDSTWTAYNAFGGMDANQYTGNSLYYGTPVDQYNADCARYVSYNRPVVNRGACDPGREYGAVEWSNFFTSEYPALMFIERNGIDVKYYSCLDAAADPTGSFLLGGSGRGPVKAAIAVGHNEYWSDVMRAGWERAKNRGVSMFFCASNEVFWRLVGTVPDSQGRPRVWECQKSTISGRGSSRPEWTGTWRDSDGAGKGGNNPENLLTGTIFAVNGPDMRALVVPFTGGYSAQPLWRNTTVAALSSGSWSSPSQILGFEWDTYGPAGVSTTGATWMAAPHPRARFCSDVTYTVPSAVLTDAGDVYSTGDVTHRLVVHPGGAGAIVFGTGTMNWALGLDPANYYQVGNDNMTPVIQQATLNMLTDMGAPPTTLMAGMTQPSAVDWYPDIVTGTIVATTTIPAASNPARVTPATVAATTVIPSVSMVTDSRVSPTTVVAGTSIPTVVAAGGSVLLAETLAAVAALAEPEIRLGLKLTPATVSGAAVVPAAVFFSSAAPAPATVTVVSTVRGEAIPEGSVPQPVTVAAKAATPAATVRCGAMAPAATVAAVAAIPATSIGGGTDGKATPVTVTVVVAVGAPGVTYGHTVTPATVSAGASFPTAVPQASRSVNITPGTVQVTVLYGVAIPNSIVPKIVAWRSYITDTTGR